jgi:hypothetical protein
MLFVGPKGETSGQFNTYKHAYTNRSPTWTDFNSMPYINCIVKEGMRYRPVYDESCFNH